LSRLLSVHVFYFIGELQGGVLPYWQLDAKRPCLLPSAKPCGPWSWHCMHVL